MRLPPSLAVATLAALAAVSRPIAAGPARAFAEDDPLTMSADKLDLDVEARTAKLTGHVKLARGAMTLRCERVDARYDEKHDKPRVSWVKGTGGVVAEIKGVKAEAPEVEIDLVARSMALRGGVKITHGEGFLQAERASIDIATGRVSMTDVKGSIPIPKPAP
jgi:lipopolysaccharide export system protein LptA